MGCLLVVRIELLVQCPGFLAADCCMTADIDRVGVCVCKLPVPDMFLAQCYYDAPGRRNNFHPRILHVPANIASDMKA